MPAISVIIPCYNSWGTLSKLLDSLRNSSFSDFEIIVVDDFSTAGGSEKVKGYPVKLVKLEKRSGPAAARNRGASIAGGEILFFLDADVIVEKDTLGYIYRRYRDDPQLKCLVGIYASQPANAGLFTHYKALLTTYWFQGLSEYNSFETACGSIRKTVFQETGGFDENFTGADVEDYEFGYRLRQKYKLVMDTRLQVRHHFPSFRTNARNYFKRTFLWTRLFFKRKEFDQRASSLKEILQRSPALLFFLAPVCLFFPARFFPATVFTAALLYTGMNSGFFCFCLKKRGLLFSLYSIGTHMINSIIIFSSAFLAFFSFAVNPRRNT
jgi:GT2 family glycosyltransferase